MSYFFLDRGNPLSTELLILTTIYKLSLTTTLSIKGFIAVEPSAYISTLRIDKHKYIITKNYEKIWIE